MELSVIAMREFSRDILKSQLTTRLLSIKDSWNRCGLCRNVKIPPWFSKILWAVTNRRQSSTMIWVIRLMIQPPISNICRSSTIRKWTRTNNRNPISDRFHLYLWNASAVNSLNGCHFWWITQLDLRWLHVETVSRSFLVARGLERRFFLSEICAVTRALRTLELPSLITNSSTSLWSQSRKASRFSWTTGKLETAYT